MAWTYVNAGAFTGKDDARSSNGGLVPALPSGSLSGKLLVCAITNVVGNSITWTQASGGYTQLAQYSGFELWGKIAGGSESAPQFNSSSSGASAGFIACFDGAPATISAIIDAGPSYSAEFDAASSHDTPSMASPANDNCLILCGIGGAFDGFSATPITPPSGFTTVAASYYTGSFNRVSLGLAYAIQTTKAAVSASTWTHGSGATMRSRMATLSLVAGTGGVVRKLKLLANASAASAASVSGVVYSAPTGGNITGDTKYGEFTGQTFEAALESGNAVLKVPVTDFDGGALSTSSTPVALARNASYTTGIVSCTVIEE